MNVIERRPWLIAELGKPLRVVSWALNNPGFATAHKIVWREVRNADLPEDFDVAGWFKAELAANGHEGSIGFLTSRDVTRFFQTAATVEDVTATVVATTGLSNAERVGLRGKPLRFGTINIAVALSEPMADAALLEALSIAVEARTLAVMDHGPDLSQGRATGTGTDCIAVAAPAGETIHAGKHTAIGHAVGAAVLDAVTKGVKDWMSDQKIGVGDA
ncbi:MAG: adenosylcobinamide amidohydrolase [Pseudomonadota bacterium]